MLTVEQFSKCFPEVKAAVAGEWVDALNRFMPVYGIDKVEEVAAFLAQCGHESCGFTRVSENLNYSATGLLSTFSKYFNAQSAQAYARKPEMIANRVYANRNGNGNEQSGDGWRFRGRGCIQITFRDGYKDIATATGRTLEDVVAYMETIPGAVESACIYWKSRGLNELAEDVPGDDDAADYVKITKRINGGVNGLKDRQALLQKVMGVLA